MLPTVLNLVVNVIEKLLYIYIWLGKENYNLPLLP